MGHSSISDTAYYLRLTAESYPQIAARVQRELGDIVPAALRSAADDVPPAPNCTPTSALTVRPVFFARAMRRR